MPAAHVRRWSSISWHPPGWRYPTKMRRWMPGGPDHTSISICADLARLARWRWRVIDQTGAEHPFRHCGGSSMRPAAEPWASLIAGWATPCCGRLIAPAGNFSGGAVPARDMACRPPRADIVLSFSLSAAPSPLWIDWRRRAACLPLSEMQRLDRPPTLIWALASTVITIVTLINQGPPDRSIHPICCADTGEQALRAR